MTSVSKTIFLYCVFAFAMTVIDVTVVLYLWLTAGVFISVISYMMGMFVIIPFGSLFFERYAKLYGYRFPLIISAALCFTVLGIGAIAPDWIVRWPIVVGLLVGLGYVSFFSGINDHIALSHDEQNQTFIYSRTGVFHIACYALVPLVLFFVEKATGSFSVVFLLGMAGAVLALAQSATLASSSQPAPFTPIETWKKKKTEVGTLILLGFVYGVREGLFWAFFSVLTLMIVGSVGYWAVVSFLLSIVRILTTLLLGKITFLRMFEEMFLLWGVIFVGSSILFLANYSVSMFLLFALVNAIYSSVVIFSYSKMRFALISSDVGYKKSINEYSFLSECSIGVGRIVPLLLMGPLFVSVPSGQVVPLIAITFVIAGYIPQIFLWVIKRSPILAAVVEPEVPMHTAFPRIR